jgi:hypothetical protein
MGIELASKVVHLKKKKKNKKKKKKQENQCTSS